jgi:hypothetical protein
MTRKAHIQIDIEAKLADEFAAAVTSAQTSEASAAGDGRRLRRAPEGR